MIIKREDRVRISGRKEVELGTICGVTDVEILSHHIISPD